MFPGIAAPSIVTRFAGSRDGVETPHLLAGRDIKRFDGAANAIVAGDRSEHNFILHNQRCFGTAKRAAMRIGNIDVPYHGPVTPVERKQASIGREEKKAIAEHCQAAIQSTTTKLCVLRDAIAVAP